MFNFVFNYSDDSDFKFLRLDNRKKDYYPNLVLKSSQKYSWKEFLLVYPERPPDIEHFHVQIYIDFPNWQFDFVADNQTYMFEKSDENYYDLLYEIHQSKRIGFFNEVGPLSLSNIEIVIS